VIGTRFRGWINLGILLALYTALIGCVTPASGLDTYVEKFKLTQTDAVSELRTAEIAASSWLDGSLTGPYAEVVVVDAESALDAATSTFLSVLAPDDPAANRLRVEAAERLDIASSALDDLRIAVQRADRVAASRSVREVSRAAEDLESVRARSR
jgi:hypothetical protein